MDPWEQLDVASRAVMASGYAAHGYFMPPVGALGALGSLGSSARHSRR